MQGILYKRQVHLLLFIVSLFFAGDVFGQEKLSRNDSILFIENGQLLTNAMAGGFNNPQFSSAYLDNDTLKDLFVFDRSGNRISVFLLKNIQGSYRYVYSLAYKNKFPAVTDWAFLRDYNCDGLPDLLCSAGNGIKVYENNGTSFNLVNTLVLSDHDGLLSNLYVSKVDIASIEDMDGDGDLDVMSFPVSGTEIEYHKNFSIEDSGKCGFNSMKRMEACWGKVREDFSTNSVYLNQSCKGGVQTVDSIYQNQHAGSTVFSFDNDGDGDRDVLLGDISFPRLTFLKNGGDQNASLVTEQDTAFPSYDTSVQLPLFPACYFIDVDQDQVNDLLVSPNASNSSENFKSVWLYKNNGTNTAPNFSFQMPNFLQKEMVDVGEGAYPTLFDYNGDGLKDIVIGNYGYKTENGFQSKLALYKNSGTANKPSFELVSRDYANLGQYMQIGLSPAFADLDEDGDEDLICGNQTGQLLYFENTSGAGNIAFFTLKSANYSAIDVGSYAKPFFYDVNKDGKKDLIIGSSDGKISFYQDTSLTSTAAFKLIKKPWGNINIAALQNQISGYANPVLTEENGQTVLYSGSSNGWIFRYDQIDGNLNGTFRLTDTLYDQVIEGSRTHLCIGKIDNDTKPSFIIGNYAGGISIYKQVSQTSVKPYATVENTISLQVSPNPSEGILTVKMNVPFCSFVLTDIGGKTILTKTINNGETIDIQNLNKGLYFMIPANYANFKPVKISIK